MNVKQLIVDKLMRCKAIRLHITKMEDTNRLLCRELDESQRVVEARDERIKELEIENKKLKNLNYQLQANPNSLGSILAK